MCHTLACVYRTLLGVPCRPRAILLCLLLPMVGMALCGCGDDKDELKPLKIDRMAPDPQFLAGTSPVPTYTEHPAPVQPTEALKNVVPIADPNSGVVSTPIAPAGADLDMGAQDRDYLRKVDVYWMLRWVRKELLTGPPPPNMDEALAKIRKSHADTRRDADYDLTEEALHHLEKGWEFYQAIQILQAAHVTTRLLPWGAGGDAMKRFIENGGVGFGAKRTSSATDLAQRDGEDEDDLGSAVGTRPLVSEALTPIQQQAMDIMRRYADLYHASPEQMMRQELRAAIQKINDLRESLRRHPSVVRHPGLNNPAEKSDDESSTEPSGKINSSMAERGVRDVVPIPRVGSDTSDLDDETPHGPNPFNSSNDQ